MLPENLSAHYPFTPKKFTLSNGHSMSYVDEGQNDEDVVILLHGNPTWSFYYRHLIETLAPHHRVIAPDHLGMGLSDKPQDYAYTLENHAENIKALIKSLHLKKFSLVVHDWGGAIGMKLATDNPERITKIVITNTAAFPSPVIPKRIDILRGKKLGETLIRGLNAFAWPATYMAVQTPLSKSVRQGYLYPYRTWHDRIAIARFVQDIPMSKNHPTHRHLENTEKQLHQLQSPVLVVWGRQDFCFNDHFLERWREHFPQARVKVFEHAGHYVLEDARVEACGEISTFLQGTMT